MAQWLKNPPARQESWETWAWSLGQGDLLEKGMTTHSGFLAWRTPWRGKTGGLPSIGLQSIRLHWTTWHIHIIIIQPAVPNNARSDTHPWQSGTCFCSRSLIANGGQEGEVLKSGTLVRILSLTFTSSVNLASYFTSLSPVSLIVKCGSLYLSHRPVAIFSAFIVVTFDGTLKE